MPRSTTSVPGPPRPWWPVVAVLVVAVLAGCASPLAPAPSGVAPPPPGTVDGRFPVTVEHGMGETVVPAAPRRVVADGETDLDALLALGVRPAGMSRNPYLLPSYVRERLDGPAPERVFQIPGVHGFVYGPDRTELRGVDLISTASYAIPRERYDADRGIAPTITPPTTGGEAQQSWRDTLRLVARAVGRPVRGEQLIAGVEARIATAPSRHPQLVGRTGACVFHDYRRSSSGRFAVAPSCTEMLTWLGMRGTPGIDAPATVDEPFPYSAADIVAARPDVVVLADTGEGTRHDLLFPPGVRIVDLDADEVTALQSPSVLSIPAVLESAPSKLVLALQ